MSDIQQAIDSAKFASFNISAEIEDKLKSLDDYDLSSVTNQFTDEPHQLGRKFSNEQIYPILMHFGRADLALAQRLEREFKRFVALTLVRPGIVSAPSGPVDMYWHFFILHTTQYRDFCERIWGSFEISPRG